ncbi:hypothetical protein DEJ00_08460 [Curtobacterium sp. MCLR17_039]|nr:hypothetical protein DEJ00_08460 [Curtobacterium sp. MCLR17_039]
MVEAIHGMRAEKDLLEARVTVGFATASRDSPVGEVMHSPEFDEQLRARVPDMSIQWHGNGYRKDFYVDGEGATMMMRASSSS